MPLLDHAGNAVTTQLNTGFSNTDLSFVLTASTGWPTGGANGKFYVTINRGNATEERILVNSRSGTTCSIAVLGDRGKDGTSAVAHNAGETVEHTFAADEAHDNNQHIYTTTRDDHSQYMKTDGTRHDLSARHTYGAALGSRPTPVAVGTSLQAGSGSTAAAGDHVHTVGVGAINAANMFTAGVVDTAAIGTDQVGTLEIAPLAVTSAELGALSVIAGKINTGAIDDFGLFTTDTQPLIIATSATRPGSPFEGQFIYETDTDRFYFYTGTVWRYLMGGNPLYSARASHSSSGTIAAGSTQQVSLATEQWDYGSNFAASGYTAPLTGHYPVSARVSAQLNNSPQDFTAIVRVAGVDRVIGSRTTEPVGNTNDPMASVVTDTISLTAGDVVTLWALNAGGVNVINIVNGATETFLKVDKLP